MLHRMVMMDEHKIKVIIIQPADPLFASQTGVIMKGDMLTWYLHLRQGRLLSGEVVLTKCHLKGSLDRSPSIKIGEVVVRGDCIQQSIHYPLHVPFFTYMFSYAFYRIYISISMTSTNGNWLSEGVKQPKWASTMVAPTSVFEFLSSQYG